MNINPQVTQPTIATTVNPPTDSLRRENVQREVPSMLSYKTHIDKDSMFNTPSVFAIYVSMLTLEWLKDLGGIDFIEGVNNKKADLLYSELDRNPLFQGLVEKEDRSIMNATFVLKDNTPLSWSSFSQLQAINLRPW